MPHYRVLKQQLKKSPEDLDLTTNEIFKKFLNGVNDSYVWSDQEKIRFNRAISLVSEELNRAYTLEKQQISLLQSTLDASPDGILLASGESDLLFMNQQVADIFQTTQEKMKEASLFEISKKLLKLAPNAQSLIDQIYAIEHDTSISTACTLKLYSGKVVEVISRPRFVDKEYIGRVWAFRDITQSRFDKQTTGYGAYHDMLTNLANRRLFIENVENALIQYSKDATKFCIMYIDLDGFKHINDTLGHEVGDNILKVIASRLQEVVGERGVVARHGGDEFLILLNSYKHLRCVQDLAQKILVQTAKPIAIESLDYFLSASVGIALAPEDGEDASTLIRHADMAMYKGKEQTKNCYEFFNYQLEEAAEKELYLKTQLHHAITNNEFQLYFQPKIDVTTKRIIGAEALIRWKKEDSTEVAPAGEFIEVAERGGLIIPISNWVIEEAISKLAKWKDIVDDDFTLNINVSPQHFNALNLVDTFKEVTKKYDVAACNVEIEITEGAVMDPSLQNRTRKLQELLDEGFSVAIDDFGQGYSSFAYLKTLPINVLKIDKEFIKDVTKSEQDHSLVKCIVDIAHVLNLKVIAEGVETEEDHQIIADLGCEMAQGYHYSRPLPEHEFLRLMQ